VASLALVLLILPGKEEAWRRFYQELAGTRRAEYEQSRRQLGITREHAWIVQTHPGELLIAYLEVEHLEQMLPTLLVSDLPFDDWFRQQCQGLHGLDVRQRPAWPPKHSELIFAWYDS
jgi:hypothetical protein